MVDLTKFGSSISNPYKGRVGGRDFSECVYDPAVQGNVLHVRKFQTLIQALGYFKYLLCESASKNYKIYFRGQEQAYGKVFQPALYRGCNRVGTLMSHDGALNRQIALSRKCCSWFKDSNDSVIEGVFQQYGMRTRWIDAVDNVWIALWFACHHAWSWKDDDMEFLHYTLRSPRSEGTGPCYAYIYVLGFNMGYPPGGSRDKRLFVPGMCWGPCAEMLDLRYAVPSLFIRPHAQHGVLMRSFHRQPDGAIKYDSDMSGLVQGVIRIDLVDALAWLGQSAALDVSSIFPPPAYDSGYGDLLRAEQDMREKYFGRQVNLPWYKKKFQVSKQDLLRVQKIG